MQHTIYRSSCGLLDGLLCSSDNLHYHFHPLSACAPLLARLEHTNLPLILNTRRCREAVTVGCYPRTHRAALYAVTDFMHSSRYRKLTGLGLLDCPYCYGAGYVGTLALADLRQFILRRSSPPKNETTNGAPMIEHERTTERTHASNNLTVEVPDSRATFTL